MSESSGHPPWACESVEDRLLDLVYGELPEHEAREVRAHAEGCEGCGRSLARLEGGRAVARRMVAEEPRADLLDAVRAAARAKAAESAARVSGAPVEAAAPAPQRPRPSESPQERGWWSDLLRWLGSMAMGPQVAMATLLMLMIGIGLWSLPGLRGRSERASTDAVVEPDPAGEVAPSRALEPAEPLAFGFDPRTRRLAPIGDEEQTGAVVPRGPSPRAPAQPVTPPAERRGAPRSVPEPETVARVEAAREREDRAQLARVEQELAPGEVVGSTADAPAPEGRAEAAGSAYAAAEAQRVPQQAQAPATGSAPRAYGGYEARDEVSRPEPDAETLLATALHQQARGAATQGAYGECVRQYQSLLARYPRYSEAGRALIELAECQRRAGRVGDAQRTLERAQRMDSVRAEATRDLARLRMEERAAEPPPSTTSAEP